MTPHSHAERERLTLAHAYLGLRAEQLADLDTARHHYSECVRVGLPDYLNYVWAEGRLNALR